MCVAVHLHRGREAHLDAELLGTLDNGLALTG